MKAKDSWNGFKRCSAAVALFWFFPLALGAEESAAPQESLIWMEVIFPPGYIQEGPNQDQGYEDIITAILKENLPEYRHEKVIGNVPRMYHEFKQQKNVCNVALFRTPERETFMHFSLPSTFTLPNGLITTASKAHLYSDGVTVNLEETLKSGRKLGVSRDRSYGEKIDAVLAKHKGGNAVFIHSGQDVFEGLLKMLLTDRLDCILGLPEEVMYVAEQMGVAKQIASFGLTENEGDYKSWLGCVACAKTDWGKQAIDRINRVLLQQRPTERYRKAYERWLDAKSIENYRKLYDEVFLSIIE